MLGQSNELRRPPRLTTIIKNIPIEMDSQIQSKNEFHQHLKTGNLESYKIGLDDCLEASHLILSDYSKLNNSNDQFMIPQGVKQLKAQLGTLNQSIFEFNDNHCDQSMQIYVQNNFTQYIPKLHQFKDSLQFQQPQSILNSLDYDIFNNQPVQNQIINQPEISKNVFGQNQRQEKVQRFREKRKKLKQPIQVYYQNRKKVADSRLRINGRFISRSEQQRLIKLIPQGFNKNNNLNIDVVSKQLNVSKTFNQIGYGVITKKEIFRQVDRLIKKRIGVDKILIQNIKKKNKIFYIISQNISHNM